MKSKWNNRDARKFIKKYIEKDINEELPPPCKTNLESFPNKCVE